MKSTLFVAAIALAFAATAFETEESVIVGTDSTFDAILAENEHVLVEFYAPWCGHCKSLAPEYAKAAQQLESEGSAVKLVKVDATIHSASAEKFEVGGYPTLKFFTKGQASEYNGGRTAPEIVGWLKKKTGPVATPVADVTEAKLLAENNEVVVFGFFASAESDEAKAFLAAAAKGDIFFAISTEAAVAAEYKVTAPAIVVVKKFDEGRVDFAGAFTADAIGSFAHASSLPLVIDFTEESAPKIFGGDIKIHVILFAKKSDAATADLKAAFATVSKANSGKYLFVFIDGDVQNNLRIMEFFGLTEESLPAVRLIKLAAEMAKFAPPTKDITVESLSAFLAGIEDGSIGRHLNTQETPADWDAQPVKVLTGKNFNAVAKNPDTFVFVEFYAPWCGHCKQLAPVWDQLAEAYAAHPSVVIAKIDSTQNELEGIAIEGFPTLKLFPAGSDEPIAYDGGRDFAALAAFLKTHTGIEVAVPAEHDHDSHEGHDHDHDEL